VTYFAFPSGGASTGASLHLRLPLRRRQPRRRVHRLHLRLRLPGLRPAHAGRRPDGDLHQGLHRNALVRLGRRLRRRRPCGAEYLGCQLCTSRHRLRVRRLRPALPASSTHLRRDVQLGFRRRLRRAEDGGPGSEFRPAPGPIVLIRCVCRPVEN
jgi:hypothetical protein